MTTFDRLWRWIGLVLLCGLAPLAAHADDDPPGRVGRVTALQGGVSMYDNERGQWVPAVPNRPLTQGDRLSTDPDGHAQVDVGSTTLRLDGSTELEVLRLDDERVRFQLHSGSAALRVRAREVADETEIATAEVRLHPLRSGYFRVERDDDSTYVTAWRGEMRVEDNDQPFTVDAGRRAEVWREGPRHELRRSWTAVPDDDFTRWAQADDQRQERSVAQRYVSPEMTGAQDLDRYGQWEQHPEYGAIWTPTTVVAGWAPYRYGHWAWVAPWGWTWVDDAPWGFAPFHYGRWVSWRGRWCWSPGVYVARPVYAPALVAWVGGPGFNVSVQVGAPVLPAVGWVPLAPREVFVPYYRVTPVYTGRLNPQPPGRRAPPAVPTGPVMYGNQAVPGAVTVVPRDVLVRREPVARAVIATPEVMKHPQPVLRAPPVAVPAPVVTPLVPGVPQREPAPRARPPRLQPVPGGAERVDRSDRGERNDPAGPRAGAQPVSPQPVQPVQPQPGVERRAPAPVPSPQPLVDLRSPRPEATRPTQRTPERGEAERADRDSQRRAAEAAREAELRTARERQVQERQVQERQVQERQTQERQAQDRLAQERNAQERLARERQAQEAARQAQERARQEAAPRAAPAPAPVPVQAPPRAPERDDGRTKQTGNPRDRDVR